MEEEKISRKTVKNRKQDYSKTQASCLMLRLNVPITLTVYRANKMQQ